MSKIETKNDVVIDTFQKPASFICLILKNVPTYVDVYSKTSHTYNPYIFRW